MNYVSVSGSIINFGSGRIRIQPSHFWWAIEKYTYVVKYQLVVINEMSANRKDSPIRKSGMEMKKPALAQTRVTAAFFRYLPVLGQWRIRK
jgi:hypothetical protein